MKDIKNFREESGNTRLDSLIIGEIVKMAMKANPASTRPGGRCASALVRGAQKSRAGRV